MKKLLLDQKGAALINVLFVTVLLGGVSAGIFYYTITVFNSTKKTIETDKALILADSGIEKAIWLLNYDQNAAWPYTSVAPESGTQIGEYEIDVTDPGIQNTKEITSTGCVPDCTNPTSKRTVTARVTATPSEAGIAFSYAIQAGAGGISVGGSSEVKGSLYSNGGISISCPSAKVQNPGNAWAVGSITGDRNPPNNCIKGTKTAGAPAVTMPPVDLAQWETLAENGGTIDGNYSPPNSGSYTSLGPKRINGNFTMSSSGQKVNLTGPLYITGNLTISGGEWKLDDSFGAFGTIVLVNGTINISGSPKFFGNSSGSFILFVSKSNNNTESSPAISYSGSGDGEKLALYAYNGSMKLTGSGKIVAMTGQTLYISGSGEIEYDSGLATAGFSGGPGGSWTIQAGSYKKL